MINGKITSACLLLVACEIDGEAMRQSDQDGYDCGFRSFIRTNLD